MKFTLLAAAAVALFMSAPVQADSFDKAMPPELKNMQAETMISEEKKMAVAPIRAVAFHSDNCGSCKILGPRMMKAVKILNPEKVEIIKFDLTNEKSIAETKELAAEKGVDNILLKHGTKTGFAILVNSEGTEVDILKVDHDVGDIASKLAKAVADAS